MIGQVLKCEYAVRGEIVTRAQVCLDADAYHCGDVLFRGLCQAIRMSSTGPVVVCNLYNSAVGSSVNFIWFDLDFKYGVLNTHEDLCSSLCEITKLI